MFYQMDKNKKEMVETLTRGRSSAMRLQSLLHRKVNADGSVSVDDLVIQVLGSFSTCLSVLNSFTSGEFVGSPASPREGLDRIAGVYTGDTGKKPAPAVRERRGCYKRRLTTDSCVKISDTSEDGYAWRKYGQKGILNSKFPRCYFRCTHKHVHGCKAIKQVQKLEDGSNKLHITYIGHHSCPPTNTFSISHPRVVLDCKNSKNQHNLPSNLSTITNANIDPSQKQEVLYDYVSSPNDAQSSLALEWKDILINDLEYFNNDGFLGDI